MLKCALTIIGLGDSFCKGMKALGNNSSLVKPSDTSLLYGSVDLDKALQKRDPNGSRWDYLLEYNNEIYCIEVHPADGEHRIKEIKNKVDWLKAWLRKVKEEWANSSVRCRLNYGEVFLCREPFIWIATGGVSIKPSDKRVAQLGVKLVGRMLELRVDNGSGE